MHSQFINQEFKVSQDTLDDFYDFLEGEGVPVSRQELSQYADALTTLLQWEIFVSLWGEEAAMRATLESDPQLQRAIEAIPEAAKLIGAKR